MGLASILTCSLIVTGSTVGTGTLILPEVASGPGMFSSLMAFLAIYVLNLLSGLVIGEVTIQQQEKFELNPNTGICVPSSYQSLAENLGNECGVFIAFMSILSNWCILA